MRVEELFELIDGIDDDIILDIPRLKSERPIKVVVENRKTPIWAVALLAACLVCVIAVGVFFAAKLQSGQIIDPGSYDPVCSDSSSIDSDSSSSSDSDSSISDDISSSSSESSDTESDSNSEDSTNSTKVTFTDEDKELQKRLEEIEEGLGILISWNFFEYPDDSPEYILITLDGEKKRFYPIPDDYIIGDVHIPNTYEEMYETVLEYFSEQFADDYMYNHVSSGSMKENSDGTFSLTLDENSYNGYVNYIAIDGKIYCYGRYMGGGRGFSNLRILCKTAKIINKTDDTIEFAYFSNTNNTKENIIFMQSCINDVSLYKANTNVGVLKYERGGWRRDWDKN